MPRRGRNALVACEACRARKVKCDGASPVCGPCKNKSTLCTYSSTPTLSRIAALKAEHKELEIRRSKLLTVYRRLKHGTASEVSSLIERLRTEDGIPDLSEHKGKPSQSAVEHQSADNTAWPVDVSGVSRSNSDFHSGEEILFDSNASSCSVAAAASSYTETSGTNLRCVDPWEAAALTASLQQSGQPLQQLVDTTSLSKNDETANTPRQRRRRDDCGDESQSWPPISNMSPVIDRLAIGKVCPFNTIFSSPEAQWGADTAGDFDFCIEQAFSALSISDNAMAYPRPEGKELIIDMRHDNLLLRVAGLVTGAPFSGSLGYHASTRPFLCYFRHSVLCDLQGRVSMEGPPTRSLVAIVALLAGWERVYGDPRAHGIHLQALKSMLVQMPSVEKPSHETSELQNTMAKPVRGPSPLPPGFAFLARQNLLPAGILDLIGPTINPDMKDPTIRNTIIHLGTSSVGIRPKGPAALEAERDGHVGSYVATYCRVAAGMYHTLMMTLTIEDFWQSAFMDVMEPMYAEVNHIPLWQLLGTVYDKVLLWCLCSYYVMVGRLGSHHLQAFRKLLDRFNIPRKKGSWSVLRNLMQRYIYHDTIDLRLLWILEKEEADSTAANS